MKGFYKFLKGKGQAPGAWNFTKKRNSTAGWGHKLSLFAALFLLLSTTGVKAAALSGAYTINPSGTSTLPNFLSFATATASLASNGVSGACTFVVSAGTYTTGVSVGAVTGASATNTIKFTCASGAGRYSSTPVNIKTGSNTAINMSGANYVTFDDMVLTTSGASYVVNVSNSTYCGVTNSILLDNGSSTTYIIYSSPSKYFTLNNCYVYGGYYQIYQYGSSASTSWGFMQCTNNRFIGCRYNGFYDWYAYGDNFSYNVLDSSQSGATYGTYFYYTNGLTLNGNKFFASFGYDEYSIYGNYQYVTGSPKTWICTNNIMTNFQYYAFIDEDLYISAASGGENWSHNTVYGGVSGYLLGEFVPEDGTSQSITFCSNILYNTNSSYEIYMLAYGCPNDAFIQMDGNDYYSANSSATWLFEIGSAAYSYNTYSGYIGGIQTYINANYETHSTNIAPTFVSTSSPFDFHLAATSAIPAGVYCGVNYDADNQHRFKSTAAGAYESLVGIKKDNAGVFAVLAPFTFCPGTASYIVDVADLGLNDLSSVKVGWSVDGVVQTPVSIGYTIKEFHDTAVTLGTFTFVAGVNHTLKAWTYLPNGNADTKPSDDTIVRKNISPSLSGTFTIDPSKGSTPSNFTNFSNACTALTNNGICGPVLFKVAQGTYSEQVKVSGISGVSATNTITFDGGVDSSKTIVVSSAQPTVNLGSNYVTWTHFTTKNTGANIAICVQGNYETVSNGRALTDSVSSSSYNAAGVSFGSTPTSTGGSNNCTISHVYISGGYYGALTAYGSSGTSTNNKISYCKILNGYYYGCYIFYQNFFTFSHNVLKANPTQSGYCYLYYSANATFDGNYFYPSYYLYMYGMDASPTGGTSYVTNNAFVGHSYASSDLNYFGAWYGTKIWYNVFYETATGSVPADWTGVSTLDVRNNIFYRTSSSQYAFQISSPSSFAAFDYNDFVDGPGVSGGPNMNGTSTVQAWQVANVSNPAYSCAHCISTDPGFKSLSPGTEDFHIAKGGFGVSGNGNGISVTYDFDGDKRCVLFPNMGLDEVLAGKGAPNVNFFPTSNDFPGSPSLVYSNYKPGSPVASTWYLNNSTYPTLTKVPMEGYVDGGDSVVLYTTKFTTGYNTLKLVQITCGGKDSVTKTFYITAPTAVPVSDFVANKNLILTGDIVSFHDLSTNGPQTWSWTVSPDSVIAGGAKVPSVKWFYPPTNAQKAQNPQVQFLYPGQYTICLQTTNGVGKGTKVCKTNYINVLPAVNIGSVNVVTTASGYIYDDGGATGNYINNGGAPSTLIQPCADSVYLTFSVFDLNCNVAFLQIYQGTSVTGKRLDPCGGTGLNSGFTGGPTATCTAPCFPSITRPDTFRAAKAMFLQMNDGATNTLNKGFAAYWWSKPTAAGKPIANFIDNGSHDSVCVNAQVNFTNTSTSAKNDPNDPLTFLWDLDGDITTWECIGTCPTALWPYFLAGPTNVTLLATNCGGTDTFVRTLYVYTPKPPKASFIADNTTPSIGQDVFFSVPVKECIDDYKWTMTKSAGSGSGTATFLQGTNSLSANPVVSFSDLGFYDIKLYVDNNSGAAKDSITLHQYIDVKAAICVPTVAILNQGMGISGVTLNTLSNKVTQAQQDYTNFTSNPALTTTLSLGVKYPITVTRDPGLIYNPINRSVFIDWNGDGLFTGKGEEAAVDSNSLSASWTGTITVPKTAKIGATIMRVAVNIGSQANLPCGQNAFGEYQDYTIYITPYNQLPVISLTGHQGLTDTIKLEQGHCFVEPGFKATSQLYGDLTKQVVVTSGPLPYQCVVAGTYVYKYNVTDSAGNKAITQYRVVEVTKDVTPPVLVIAGPDTALLEVTSSPTSYNAPSVVSALDLVDGDLSLYVTNDAAKVTTNILGFYTITYTVTDLSLNTATVYRYVKVIDTIAPIITILGNNPDTIDVGTSYVDGGVTITDNYDKSALLNSNLVVTSTVDSSKVGTYTVTYNVSDGSNNKATPVTRIVVVADRTAPTVVANGPLFDSVEVKTLYDDKGVVVSDNYKAASNVVTLVVTGSFYKTFSNPKGVPTALGTYTIIYTATDAAGNKTVVTRNVLVYDHIAPVLTLNGPSTATVCRWFNYVDAGVTITDNYYSAASIQPTLNMYLNGSPTPATATDKADFTSLDGFYSLSYSAKDGSGNIGYSPIRYVLVNPIGNVSCPASGIQPGLGLDKYISVYPNPNNGMFTINASLPSQEKVRMTVTNMLGQEIAVVHDGTLGSTSFQVDLSNQVSGMYLLNIVSNNQSITKRIEIAR